MIEDNLESRHDLGVMVAKAFNNIAKVEAAIKRVRDLHQEVTVFGKGAEHTICNDCDVPYPCLTIKALDGE